MSNEDEYEFVMEPTGVAYSTLLKELLSCAKLVGELQIMPKDLHEDITTRILGLLQGECYIQQSYQAEQIKVLKETQAKDNIKLANNVVPLTKGDK